MSNKAQPITPDEATKAKEKSLPNEVIEAFNELIAENWDGHKATFKQDAVVARIVNKKDLKNSDIIFRNHWLDVEDIYRATGWKVEYDKPAFNESYPATFTFSRRK